MSSVRRTELMHIAGDIAREAGGLLARRLPELRVSVDTKSTITDMVTDVDRESERLVRGRLLQLRPHDGFVGEEGTSATGTSGVRWIVDPLDGTTNYIYRFPAFAVSIAASLHGDIIAGAVFDAVRSELFTAARGMGAFRDGQRMEMQPSPPLAQALIGTGFGYDPRRRWLQGQVLSQIIPHIRDIRRAGSAALDLCWVAAGRLDGYYESGLQPWDRAAGGLIVMEAGGMIGTLAHDEMPGAFIATGRDLFPQLVDALRAAGYSNY